MIEIEPSTSSAFVTFELAHVGPVSVVGSFNDWNPLAHPLEPNERGFRWVTVELAPGRYEFRYLAEEGHFFDETDYDLREIEENGIGGTHGVLTIHEPHAWSDAAESSQFLHTPESTYA
jgi:1,4-alpha-glucan branching enzyme